MKMRGLIGVALFLVLAQVALGSLNIDVIKVDDRIKYGERAEFTINITNRLNTTVEAYITSPNHGFGWDIKTQPISNQEIELTPFETREVELVAEPIEKFSPGVYIVKLEVQEGESVYRENLQIYIGDTVKKSYVASIRADIEMQQEIVPKETYFIDVSVANLNPLNLTGLELKVISDIPELNSVKSLPLAPLSKDKVQLRYEIRPTQEPKDYIVFFQFESGGDIVKIVDKKVEVLPVREPFESSVEKDKMLLKQNKVITVTNNGNVEDTQSVKYTAGIIESIFTRTSPDARRDFEGLSRVMVFETELEPGQSAKIYMTTSYRVPVVVLFVALVVGILLYIYKSPVMVRKSAPKIDYLEGGVSGIKVTLIVKNCGKRTLEDVEIVDFVPGITDIEKNMEMGTLKPTQVKKSKSGSTVIKWKISELEAFEERLINYNVKSKLNIVGSFQLPRAKVIYTGKKNKRRVAYSNQYRIDTQEP